MSTDTAAQAGPIQATEAESVTLPDPDQSDQQPTDAAPLFPWGNRCGELYIPLSAYDTDTALARRVLDKLWPLHVQIVAIGGEPTLRIHACSELFRENHKAEKQLPLYEIGKNAAGEIVAIELERPEQSAVWTPNRKERREMGRKAASGQLVKP